MSDGRGARRAGYERPRFRCAVCRRFVAGTDSGHCPRCGWQPPMLTPMADEPARPARWPWLAVLSVLVVVAALAFR